ncbi:MAG: hypothetical protein K8W52_05825 [Deltaproteobacteria bacterium]|nr:hypothetical protein [Deltaproteobacteria bacterium]
MDDDVPDLRRSPWRAHGIILEVFAIAYAVLAVGAWPKASPAPSGRLEQGLSVLEGIGEGVAMGAILMGGAALLFYAAITTAILGIVPRRMQDPWLVHVTLIGVIAIAALVAQ